MRRRSRSWLGCRRWCATTTWARRSSRCSGDGGGWRPIASSRCARTFLFESSFTLVGLQGAHEKGGVEGEVGRFRRRHLVAVPDVACLGELNARLRAGCEQDLTRRIAGHPDTVGEALARERPVLRALPDEPAPTAEQTTPRVDAKSLVTVRQNRYSVPVGLVGL
jgi:Mu transposase-like protein